MKKVTMIMLLAAVAMFWGTSAFAAITGACSGCHSMHNSQDGAAQGFGESGLLEFADCVSCHSGTNDGTNSTPYVNDGTNPLAGGSFSFATDNQVHNIAAMPAGADGVLGNTPPGDTGGFTGPLTCASATGCHGGRVGADEMADISGSHHKNVDLAQGNQPAVGAAAADSYRFLKGIAGIEDADWEYTNGATDHNQYVAGAQGIGEFCANCHDSFHSAQGAAGAWTRHPTDVAVSGTGTGTFVNYSLTVPVGATKADLVASGVIGTGDVQTRGQVTCLSCHVAHGSANADLLRWSGTTGCTTCHDDK